MKILHIVPSYLPAIRYGGPIQSVHNLNKWLVKLGAEVTVYTTNSDGGGILNVPTGTEVDMDGVKIIYFPTSFPRGWYYSGEMRSAIKKNIGNFDLVHITSTFLSASTFGAYYAKKFGIPYIISPRGNLMKEPLKISSLKKKIYIALIERRNLEKAVLHFTSEEERSDYDSLGIGSLGDIVIANGIEMPEPAGAKEVADFRARLGIPDGARVVLYLGRISKIKGFDILMPAFAEAVKKDPSLRLLIVGGDDAKGYKKDVGHLISEQELQDEVIFAGMLSGKEKNIAISASDLLVQPSLSESFGMAAAEAAGAGLPSIVTRGVGLAGLIRSSGAGLVIEYSAEALKEAILRLAGDESVRKKLGENAKKMAIDDLSGESVAKKFIGEYNLLIQKHGKKR